MNTALMQQEAKEKRRYVVAPKNGQLKRKTFNFNPRLRWIERVMYGAPQTGLDWNILDVGGYFPAENGLMMRKTLILVNFGRPVSGEREVLEWAKDYRIRLPDPRKIFALGESEKRLDRLFETNPLVLSSLCRVEFRELERIPCLAWNKEGERMGLLGDPEVSCNEHFWFAFEEV